MSEKVRGDYYCEKCKHTLFESQTHAVPPRCPRCHELVVFGVNGKIPEGTPMFEPKVFKRKLEVKVGTPQITRGTVLEMGALDRGSVNALEPILEMAKGIAVIKKVLNTIADRIEDDGADPVGAVGESATFLWLLGDALLVIGRTDAAELAYSRSKDFQGDDPKER